MFTFCTRVFTPSHIVTDLVLFVNDSPRAEIKLIDFGLSTRFADESETLTDGVGTMYVQLLVFVYVIAFIFNQSPLFLNLESTATQWLLKFWLANIHSKRIFGRLE